MSRTHAAVKHWLIVVAWMLVIFGASSDIGASRHTSRIIGPIVRWLYPQISDESLRQVVFLVRKAAHVTEYAILSILSWRALQRQRPMAESNEWNWRSAGLAWAIAASYSAADELHQAFVPSRTGQWQDVALDSCGALLGILLCWSWSRRVRASRPSDLERRSAG